MTKEVKKDTKKVQNSAVSDKKEEAIDVVPVLVTERDTLPVVDIQPEVIELKPVDTEITFDGAQPVKMRRREVNSITDKPVLIVGGQEIELTKVNKDQIGFYLSGTTDRLKIRRYHDATKNSILAMPNDTWNYALPYTCNETLTNEECEWWTATVGKVKVVMTSGSELIIQDNITTGWDYEYTESGDEQDAVITLIGSCVEARLLSVTGKVAMNNALVRGDYVDLQRSTFIASFVSAYSGSVSVVGSVLRYSTINESKVINVLDSDFHNVAVSGTEHISLRKATNYAEPFRLSVYTKQGVSISLSGQLHKHTAHHHLGNSLVSKATVHYHMPTLNVKRRVDYGVFAAIEPIPFVRLNDYDILVGDVAFFAKDLFPENVLKESPADNNAVTPYSNQSFSLAPLPGWVNMERHGDLWNKAAGLVFRRDTKVIGKAGGDIVKSLLEQIRSRVGLYVEIHNLGN
ncbi:hypothetical protein PQD71_gp035 [Kosakonia phage Kc263]|uniref:Uncharacterized protein n=1 Tax=Kosakonia phage Kc263 TaxID=2863194 RepID=A0AAE8BFF8_9CAUD|nr:hypothetical protein PQD71_gp035 [Kosakonia phage Kc263]QYN79928.1 hypothetical protein [Kosakonia phage Kc263]